MEEVESDSHWNELVVSEAEEEQDLLPAIWITLARIYDLVAVLAIDANPELAEHILTLHEEGKLKGEMPRLVLEVEDEDEDDT